MKEIRYYHFHIHVSWIKLVAVAFFVLFALGIQLGFLVSFNEALHRARQTRESLHRTASE